MKKIKTRKGIFALIVMILLFGLYNLLWYSIIQYKYGKYSKDMDEFIANRSYVLNSNDGYLYNVKYPDYLTLKGNLGISDDANVISLVIWPSIVGENKYGVRIVNDEDAYEFVIDKDMNPKENENKEMLNKYIGDIQNLFQKAEEKWGVIK